MVSFAIDRRIGRRRAGAVHRAATIGRRFAEMQAQGEGNPERDGRLGCAVNGSVEPAAAHEACGPFACLVTGTPPVATAGNARRAAALSGGRHGVTC
jgi:hypothetical protein